MGKDSNSNCYKNAICISVGLLILFTTSIFVAKDYYGLRIATLIEDAALLKDYRFSDWGEQPGNIEANYTYTFTLADQSAANQISPIGFAHSFKYNDVSFGQGNQGFIKYLHQWNLTPFTPLPSTPISTINLAAEKVYAFERLAPKARRFTTLFNTLWRTAEEQLLNFYAKQLHAFYFSHKQTVFDAVYAEAGIEAALMDQLYSNTEYGWGSSETLQIWVLLAHQQNRHDLREWELVREAFGLSAAQLDRLVGDHSMLNALSTALNGTIKVILQNSRTYAYDKCQPFCSNNQLVAFQMLTNALTNSPVFVNVNLKSSLKGLNASIPNEVEFSSICTDPTTCFLDQNSLKFFASGYLRSFSTMGKVYSNIDSVQIVQGLFDLPDATYATGILSYIKYLEEYVFTPTNPTTHQLDHQAYEYMLNNHLYINTAVNDFKNILNIQLHTRAFAQLISNHQSSCEDFFQGDYAGFAGLCKKAQLDFTQLPALRTYVKAYFFNGRPEFLKATGMTSEQAIQFLRLDGQSLFSTKMKEVRKTLAESLECTGGVCNEDELLAMEWGGEKDVLSRLPPALFPHPPVSITEWDIDNKLNGIQPQFHKLMGEKLPLEKARLLLGSGPDSILVLFNLLSLKTKGDSGDQTAQKLVGYVQKVSIDVYFGGPTIKKPINDLLSGLQSKGLKVKQAADRLLGGAPWLPSQLQLIQTSRRPSAYSKLNTGIYDRNQLRSVMQVEHSGMLGSQFTIFSSENEQVTQFLSSGRSVFGTNLLGFHSDLSSTEAVAVLMDFAYQGVVLHPQSNPVEYMGVQALKYSLGNVPKVSISMNQQNERLLSLSPDSYFTVDPVTGNTLQFNVKYSVSSPASFLKYYPGGDTKEQPLFSCEVKYQRKDVSAVLEIGTEKAALRTVYIVTIILASLSMVSVVVLAILARIRGRKGERDFNETLVTSENRGSINN